LMLRVRRLDLLGICGGRRKSIGGLNEWNNRFSRGVARCFTFKILS
jgi:hypothetical protein